MCAYTGLGFSEAAHPKSHLPGSYLPLVSLQENFDFAKSAAATGLAAKQGGNAKGLIGGKLAREVVVQLFKKWVQSDDRTKVNKGKHRSELLRRGVYTSMQY